MEKFSQGRVLAHPSSRAKTQTRPRPAEPRPPPMPQERDSAATGFTKQLSFHSQKKRGAVIPWPATSLDSDPEASPPAQTLSFVVDDPEIEGSDLLEGPKVLSFHVFLLSREQC